MTYKARAKAILVAFLTAVCASLSTSLTGLSELAIEMLKELGAEGTAKATAAVGASAATLAGLIQTFRDKNLKKGEGDE